MKGGEQSLERPARPTVLRELDEAEVSKRLARVLSGQTSPKLVGLRDRLSRLDPEQRRRLLSRLADFGAKRDAARPAGAPDREPSEQELEVLLEHLLASGGSPALERLRRSVPGMNSGQRREVVRRLLGLVGARPRVAPATAAQERVWFLEQYRPDEVVQNIVAGVEAEGPLRLDLLERALNEIVGRHETLRTVFRPHDGHPYQLILPRLKLRIREVDLRRIPEPRREGLATAQVTAVGRCRFDLRSGPLLRVVSVRTGDRERLLLLVMHHIVSDEWSLGILVREVCALYRGRMLGEEVRFPPLPVQYADFARWQRDHLQAEVLERQLEHWRRQLAGAPPHVSLPTDSPRPPVQTFRGGLEYAWVSATLSNTVRAAARDQGVTLFMLLLAVFEVLLLHEGAQEDLVVGTDFANRIRPDLENLIGFFVNQLPLRTDLSGDPTFRELLRRVAGMARGAFSHPDLPFQWLVQALRLPRDRSRSPLFQVVFDLHNVPSGTLEFDGVSLAPLRLRTRPAKFDLTLFANDAEEELMLTLEYNSDLYRRSTAVTFLDRYKSLLGQVVRSPERRLSELAPESRADAGRPGEA